MTGPRIPTRAELLRALAAHPRTDMPDLPGRTNDVQAGILVPIIWGEDPICILTERPPTMRRHAGEICFPGGRPEPGDHSLEATALREAHEEVGLRNVELVGRLSTVPLLTSEHRLHPFVGLVEADELVPDPREVHRVVRFSLLELLARETIDAIPWDKNGITDYGPIFDTGGRVLFGATAYVLYELLVAIAPAFGTTAPERIPGRYRWEDVL